MASDTLRDFGCLTLSLFGSILNPQCLDIFQRDPKSAVGNLPFQSANYSITHFRRINLLFQICGVFFGSIKIILRLWLLVGSIFGPLLFALQMADYIIIATIHIGVADNLRDKIVERILNLHDAPSGLFVMFRLSAYARVAEALTSRLFHCPARERCSVAII